MRRAEHSVVAVASRAPRAKRPAFTLLEVLVALAIGGIVLLGAHAVLVVVATAAESTERAAVASDRDANGEELLRLVTGNLEVGTEEASPFVGSGRTAAFTSWCDVPAGWQERCNVVLELDATSGALLLRTDLPGSPVVALGEGFESAIFLYLADPSDGGRWLRRWGEGVTAPQALGIERGGDTTIVRIGERG